MRLLLVHGRGQGGKNAADLKATWIGTLRKGYEAAHLTYPESLEVDFPYYGDALDARVAKSELPLPRSIVPKGAGESSPYEDFVRESLREMKESASISDDAVTAEAGPIPVAEKGIANWALTQAILRLIDNRFRGVSAYSIDSFLRDVFLYVTNRSVANEINAIVTGMLTDEPTVVVGHSLGTVVAYNVLANTPTLKLRRFITVGSPLGLKTISSRLGVLQYPPADFAWYNAYDDGDVVALNPLRDPYFKTMPAVDNYDGINNDTDNQHGIIGYLNDATVARAIDEALQS